MDAGPLDTGECGSMTETEVLTILFRPWFKKNINLSQVLWLDIKSTFSTHLNLASNSGFPNASSISKIIFQYFLPLRSYRFDLQNNPEMSAFIVQAVTNWPRGDYGNWIAKKKFKNIDSSYSHFLYTNLGREALLNNKVNCTWKPFSPYLILQYDSSKVVNGGLLFGSRFPEKKSEGAMITN